MSRKLDAWIAVNVMGRLPQGEPSLRDEPDGRRPAYTTDIGAAWTVVERMREDGWELDLHAQTQGKWSAFFFRYPLSGYATEGIPQVTLAICLAAYRARTGQEWSEQEEKPE